jgi:hypothetical protein
MVSFRALKRTKDFITLELLNKGRISTLEDLVTLTARRPDDSKLCGDLLAILVSCLTNMLDALASSQPQLHRTLRVLFLNNFLQLLELDNALGEDNTIIEVLIVCDSIKEVSFLELDTPTTLPEFILKKFLLLGRDGSIPEAAIVRHAQCLYDAACNPKLMDFVITLLDRFREGFLSWLASTSSPQLQSVAIRVLALLMKLDPSDVDILSHEYVLSAPTHDSATRGSD